MGYPGLYFMKRTRAKTTRAIYLKLNNRRSKRKKKRALSGWFLIKYLFFILIFALTGLIYAKQKNGNVLLGYEVQKLKKELTLLEADQERLTSELERIKTPENLNRLIKEHGLSYLRAPETKQIVYLSRPEPLNLSSSQSQRVPLQTIPLIEKHTRLVKR